MRQIDPLKNAHSMFRQCEHVLPRVKQHYRQKRHLVQMNPIQSRKASELKNDITSVNKYYKFKLIYNFNFACLSKAVVSIKIVLKHIDHRSRLVEVHV